MGDQREKGFNVCRKTNYQSGKSWSYSKTSKYETAKAKQILTYFSSTTIGKFNFIIWVGHFSRVQNWTRILHHSKIRIGTRYFQSILLSLLVKCSLTFDLSDPVRPKLARCPNFPFHYGIAVKFVYYSFDSDKWRSLRIRQEIFSSNDLSWRIQSHVKHIIQERFLTSMYTERIITFGRSFTHHQNSRWSTFRACLKCLCLRIIITLNHQIQCQRHVSRWING